MKTTLAVLGAILALPVALPAGTGRPVGEISRDRAWSLATTYSTRYVNAGCGGVAPPVLHGNDWEGVMCLGRAGKPSGIIHVDRRTGVVSNGSFSRHVSADSLDRWMAARVKAAQAH